MCDFHSRAVKLAETLNYTFFTKILYKFKLYSNSKGTNSVMKKEKLLASLLRPQEGASSKILPNAHFFHVGLGNMSTNLYLCILG